MTEIQNVTIGVQQLGLRDAADSFEGRVEAVRRFGYQAIELLNVQRRPLEESPERVREVLGEADVAPVATHVNLEQLESELDSLVSTQRTIGCDRFVVPWVAPEMGFVENPADWAAIGRRLATVGRRCSDAGIQLGFHNHVSELLDRDGREGLFRMFDECDEEELFWEADIGHVAAAHAHLEHLLDELGDRCKLAHIRNMTVDVVRNPVLEESREYSRDFEGFGAPIIERIEWESALDSGVVDVKDAVSRLMRAGVESLIVEFHRFGPSIENGHADLTRILNELAAPS